MSLEELNEQVYKREGEDKPKPRFSFEEPVASGVHHPETLPTPSRWADQPPALEKLTLKQHFIRRKKFIIGLILVLSALVSLLIFVGRRSFLFNPEVVAISLSGPTLTQTGEPVTFTVRYANPNWVSLSASELRISYPETFQFKEATDWQVAKRQAVLTVPALGPREEKEISFTGTFQSFDQTAALLTASLRYGPTGLSSQAEKQATWGIELERSLIGIEINGPPSAMNGQGVEYMVEYRNDSSETLETGEVELVYPVGFTPTEFAPEPSQGENRWRVTGLKGGTQQAIRIKGIIRGNTGDTRRVVARIGKRGGDDRLVILSEKGKITQVIAPPLSVALTVLDSKTVASMGELLNFQLRFQNHGSFGLRDLIAIVTLDPNTLHVPGLVMPRGVSYSSATHQITFKAADVPSLRSLGPGQSGEIAFSIPVRNDFAERNMKEVETVVQATVDSPDLPRSSNTEYLSAQQEVRLKIRTETRVEVMGYYFDAFYPNTGPVPPQVGAETTYTLHLTLRSTLNMLHDGKVTLSFPSHARYYGVVSPDASGVTFNERTNEFTWKVGSVPAGNDTVRKLVIRIGVTPPPNSVGQVIGILNQGQFSAKDAFTATEFNMAIDGKSIQLSEDTQLTYNQKQVAPAQ